MLKDWNIPANIFFESCFKEALRLELRNLGALLIVMVGSKPLLELFTANDNYF